ncbi:MAG TPA: NADH-quinone oxidoreductase subunit A [Opitutaceae bacterium]|nr:NADH-quinone oxidoreductase subunit A [Opitutaceae bacterium]
MSALPAYFPVLLQLVLAAAMGVGIILASHLFGARLRRNRIKDSAYECGVPVKGKIHPRLSVKFFLTALLFILFDVEVVFLLPWTFIYREFLSWGIPVLLPALFFIGLLVFGFLYEWKKGALDWER